MLRRHKLNSLLAGSFGLAATLIIAFVIAVILMFLLSAEPGKTIFFFFVGPFTNKFYLGNMLNAAIPIVFTGLGISVAFKSSIFNLGGEGLLSPLPCALCCRSSTVIWADFSR